MKLNRLCLALALLTLSLPALAASDPKRDAQIAKLAKEGYWGEPKNWNEHAKLLGKPAPKFELTDWRGGKGPTADDMKGKVLVIDFWATWCGPCKKAVPHNNELAKKHEGKVLVIGACGGGGEETMDKVADQTKMAYPTGKASEELTKAWGVEWWPHYVVIDQAGVIRAIGVQPGAVDKIVELLLEN